MRLKVLWLPLLIAAMTMTVWACGGDDDDDDDATGSDDDADDDMDDDTDDDSADDDMDDDMDDDADDDMGGDSFALTFEGTGFDPHEGQTLIVAVTHPDMGGMVVATGSDTVEGGAFSLSFEGVVFAGSAINVDYYADVNDDGSCTEDDHAWRESFTGEAADKTLAVEHSTDFNYDACDSF